MLTFVIDDTLKSAMLCKILHS